MHLKKIEVKNVDLNKDSINSFWIMSKIKSKPYTIRLRAFLPAFIWSLLILVLSTMPSISLPETFWDLLSPDKWGHIIVYGIFTLLLIRGFRAKPTKKNIAIAVFISILYGILMEIIQYSFFPDRYFEIYDIIANIIGSFGSLLFLKYFLSFN